MHTTEHKRDACALAPWEHRNADRTCEHGDSRMKAAIKASSRKARRTADRREARA